MTWTLEFQDYVWIPVFTYAGQIVDFNFSEPQLPCP